LLTWYFFLFFFLFLFVYSGVQHKFNVMSYLRDLFVYMQIISHDTSWFSRSHVTNVWKMEDKWRNHRMSRDYEKTTMYHGRWFAYKQTNKYLYCQSYTPVKAEQLT
jgi:hypothetical protein